MTIGRIDVGEIRMAYELTGPEGAPVACLNHCFGSDLHYWDRHLAAFEGFRVLRYDTRGHGGSDAPPGPYRLEMLAADVAGLQDALGIERVHFCGVSIGGQIAQTFALDYPERVASLILVNTTCEYSDDQVARWRERARQVLDEGIEPLHATLMARWFTDEAVARQPPGYCYMAEAIRRFPPQSFAAAVEGDVPPAHHRSASAHRRPDPRHRHPGGSGRPAGGDGEDGPPHPECGARVADARPAPLEPGAPRALQFARPDLPLAAELIARRFHLRACPDSPRGQLGIHTDFLAGGGRPNRGSGPCFLRSLRRLIDAARRVRRVGAWNGKRARQVPGRDRRTTRERAPGPSAPAADCPISWHGPRPRFGSGSPGRAQWAMACEASM